MIDATPPESRSARVRHRYDAVGDLTIHARALPERPTSEAPRDGRPPASPWPAARQSAGRPAVVLLHGLMVSSRYMVPLARRLSAGFPVLVPDLPGWGRSSKPRRALSVPALADALAAWLGAVGLRRPVLVANSFGCQVAVDLAARYPGHASRLVLLGPTLAPEARGLWPTAGRWALNVPLEPIGLDLLAVRDLLDMGPKRLLGSLGVMVSDRIEEKLPRVAAPTLVVRGGHDRLVPARWAARAAALLPNGQVATIPDRPHTINYNAPDAVARLVRDFVDGRLATAHAPAPPPADPPADAADATVPAGAEVG